jgi:uncharacterized protein (DUF1778 family)
MSTAAKNQARLSFRLSRPSKELIEQAAALLGQRISEFAESALVD